MSKKVLRISDRIKISKDAIQIKILTITTVMILITAIPSQGQPCPYNVYISGTIEDSHGVGISGVTVTAEGSHLGPATTNSSGYYNLMVEGMWTGTVTPSKDGYSFFPSSRDHDTPCISESGQDYTGYPPTHSIRGYIKNSSGSGVYDVYVSANNGGGSDWTSSSGYYSLDVPDEWTGDVTPSKTDCTFEPPSRHYDNVTSDQSYQDFEADCLPVDTEPPDPNPMTWASDSEPDQTGTASVTMEASQATDETTPIRYYFDYYDSPTGGSGGTDSGWVSNRSYTDTGLSINHQYRYRVKARDSASPSNEGSYSSISSSYTSIEKPTGMKFSTITPNSIRVESMNTPSGLFRGSSGLIIENTSGTNSGWRQNNSSWNSSGLSVNTRYGFRARARNGDGDETGNCTTEYKYTYANVPGAGPFADISINSIRVTWTHNGNPSYTTYFCENTTNSTNSGWIQSTSWNNIGLSPSTIYSYRVKARNGNNVETAWTYLGSDKTSVSGSITVVSPNGGEEWQAGTSHNITWNFVGNIGSNVKIELLKDDIVDSPIIDSTPTDTKSFTWPIPADQPTDSDYKIRITSISNPAFVDESDDYFSIVDGNDVVFEDTFPSTTIDRDKWTVVDGATVDGVGINEPSPPFSLRLNGDPSGGDLVESKIIDLSSYSKATLVYYYQQTGGGNPPRAGEDLIVDYYDGSVWIELDHQLGSGSIMASYELITIALPPEVLHSNFKFRIQRNKAASGPYGDWFVDDVRIEAQREYPVKLIASDGEPGGLFGQAVSISGNCAVVGAFYDDDKCGSAYIFERDSTGWIEQQPKLTHSDPAIDDYFGCSVSISEDYAIIGIENDEWDQMDQIRSGTTYIFKRTETSWIKDNGLASSDREYGDCFGCAVSISGDYSIIGSYRDDNDNGSDSGSAYIFKKGDTRWEQEAKLTATDGAMDDKFGSTVSISGNYAIVGASYHDDSEPDCGAAYIFKRDDTDWTQKAKLLALDGDAGDEFGSSVSISGNYVVVGAVCDDGVGEDTGAAYIFERSGENWIQRAKLTPSDADGDRFGNSVSIDGDYVVVGANHDDDIGEDSGAAYIYKREGLSWNFQAKLTAPDGNERDYFGQEVSISGSYVIVGAPYDDDNGDNSGSVYIFKRNGTKWML